MPGTSPSDQNQSPCLMRRSRTCRLALTSSSQTENTTVESDEHWIVEHWIVVEIIVRDRYSDLRCCQCDEALQPPASGHRFAVGNDLSGVGTAPNVGYRLLPPCVNGLLPWFVFLQGASLAGSSPPFPLCAFARSSCKVVGIDGCNDKPIGRRPVHR